MKKEWYLSDHVRIQTIMMVIALAAIFLGEWKSIAVLVGIGMVLLLAAVACRMVFLRCPNCGCRLFEFRRLPDYCPDCGEHLF